MLAKGLLLAVAAGVTLFATSQSSADTVLDHNGITVDDAEVVFYLKTMIRPEALASSLERPGALELVAQNQYIIKRLATDALAASAISQDEYDWHAENAANREAMDRLIDQEIERRLEAVNWDTAAKERYIAKPELYSPGEEVNVDHILVSFEGRSWDELYARVAEIQAKLDAGEDFHELARAYSDDPSIERNGGTLGFFGRGAMYPSFEQAAFSMTDSGEISDPVVTTFGVHFIRFVERREGKRPGLEQVAHLIKKDLKKERRASVRSGIIEEIRAELAGVTLSIDEAPVRGKLGLTSD